MKKIIIWLIPVIFLVIGCASSNKLETISRYENLSVVDFTKYSSEGFLITTEPYKGKYKSVGIIDYVVRPKAEKQQEVYGSGYTENYWTVEKIETQSLLDTLFIQAKKLGGDAIMNFDMEPNSKRHLDGSNVIEIPGIEFYGFIIKRID